MLRHSGAPTLPAVGRPWATLVVAPFADEGARATGINGARSGPSQTVHTLAQKATTRVASYIIPGMPEEGRPPESPLHHPWRARHVFLWWCFGATAAAGLGQVPQ